MPRVVLLALAVLGLAVAAPAPALAADYQSTSTLTRSGDVLTWAVTGGYADVHAVIPAGGCEWSDLSTIPCVVVEDARSPQFSSVPAGCLMPVDEGHAYARCPLAGLVRILLTAQATGASKIDVRATCSPVPMDIHQERGDGIVQADDGCAESVSCGASYTGIVVSDSSDFVDPSCGRVKVGDDWVRGGEDPSLTGIPVQQPSTTTTSTTTTPASGAGSGGSSPAPAAKPVPKPTQDPLTIRPRPLVKVRITPRSRKLAVAVTLRRACTMTIVVQRSTAKGWKRVTTQKVKAKAGTVRRTLAAAHGRRFAKGRYRVVVSSPDSGYDLVSSALSLR